MTVLRRAALAQLLAKAGPVAIVLLAVTSGACAAHGGVPVPRPFPGATVPPGHRETPPARVEAPPEGADAPAERTDAPPQLSLGSELTQVVETAFRYLGVPYRNGGTDPSGFDCSGFVQWVFSRHGMRLPREVRDQYEVGRKVAMNEVKAGDLLFFETVSRGASHVGMALGGGAFIHAPSSTGVVRVERYTASYWASRFVGARRVADVTASGGGAVLPGSVRSSR